MTGTGNIVGTADYMSPEQVKGAKVDGRSDLFSVGCMLYELLAGRRPFHSENLMAIFYKITHEEPNFDLDPAGRRVRRAAADPQEVAREEPRGALPDGLRVRRRPARVPEEPRQLRDRRARARGPDRHRAAAVEAAATAQRRRGSDAGREPTELGGGGGTMGLARRSHGTRLRGDRARQAGHAARQDAGRRRRCTQRARQRRRPWLRSIRCRRPAPRTAAAREQHTALPDPRGDGRRDSRHRRLSGLQTGQAAGREHHPGADHGRQPRCRRATTVPPTTAPPPTFGEAVGKAAASLKGAQAAFSQGDYDRALSLRAVRAARGPGQRHGQAHRRELARTGRRRRATSGRPNRRWGRGTLHAPWRRQSRVARRRPGTRAGPNFAARIQEAKQRAEQLAAQQAAQQQAQQASAVKAAQLADLLNKADGALSEQKYDAAISLFDSVLGLDPTNQRAILGKSSAVQARAVSQAAAAGGGGQPGRRRQGLRDRQDGRQRRRRGQRQRAAGLRGVGRSRGEEGLPGGRAARQGRASRSSPGT